MGHVGWSRPKLTSLPAAFHVRNGTLGRPVDMLSSQPQLQPQPQRPRGFSLLTRSDLVLTNFLSHEFGALPADSF